MPIQEAFFVGFAGQASLVFLPHGVRVLAAWLLGWRAVWAMLPGVIITYYYLGGANVLMPERMAAMAISVLVAPAVFQAFASLGFDWRSRPDRMPNWSSVMLVGVISAVIGGTLTSMTFGSDPMSYFAFFLGDILGLFALMLLLMFAFRHLRKRGRM